MRCLRYYSLSRRGLPLSEGPFNYGVVCFSLTVASCCISLYVRVSAAGPKSSSLGGDCCCDLGTASLDVFR